jgi:hypothetical protein
MQLDFRQTTILLISKRRFRPKRRTGCSHATELLICA